MADRWEWTAVYADGSRVRERDVETFTAVDVTRCVAVEIRPSSGLFRRPVTVQVDTNAGQRATFFRRRRRALVLNPLAALGESGTLTVAGWESLRGNGYVVADDSGRVRVLASLEGV